MSKQQTNRDPATLEKYAEVVRLRAVGLTFERIAERVGYESRQGAFDAYKAAIKLWGQESVNELRLVENERLDNLWRATMGQLETAQRAGDTNAVLSSINTAIRVGNRRAALNGLDAPRQVEVAATFSGTITHDVGELFKERLGLAKEGKPIPSTNDVIDVETPSGNGQHDE